MNIIDRIEIRRILWCADRKRRQADADRAARHHLNRPHVQSVHLTGHFIPPAAKTARQHGVTPLYVVALVLVAYAVVYVNTHHADAAEQFACSVIASSK